MLAAHLAGTGDDRIGSITLLNTMLDYSEPGVLGAFTDERTVARLEDEMAAKGYLEGSQMAGTFDFLRANDLIFGYVVSGWLMGQDLPAFDLLAWNGDSTRLAAAMHSFYLRCLYVRYELASGGNVAGIVNPPGPKPWYEAAGSNPAEAAGWRAAATRQRGSWWEDWTRWSKGRASARIRPPAMGSSRYAVLADAPGEYVRG